ncbi:hypothetical protein [Paraburkholderia aromaticivorans]|uniref:hypothetical protein n=1 Tax=Paraburkholderia aromaticivorans TaxID=2026199 RepID=UPI0038BA39C2
MRDSAKSLSIATALRELMLELEADVAWAGEPDLLLAAYEKFGGRVGHPLDRIQAVIGAARKSSLFVQDGYVRACDSSGKREVLLPAFKLKAASSGDGGEPI